MTVPPLMRRGQIGTAGRASERRLAKDVGGKLTPASGAVGVKGDIDLGRVLMEAKSTIANSMALKFEWLAKIAKEARMVGKEPALAVSFTTGDGRPVQDGEWVLVPLRVWKEMQGS